MLGREKCFARNTTSSQRKNFMKLAVNKTESAVNGRIGREQAEESAHGIHCAPRLSYFSNFE